MENFEKNGLNLSTAVVIGCLILGFAFYMVQANKQRSIEKQQQLEMEMKKEQESKAEQSKLNLQNCLDESLYQVQSSHLWMCSSIGRTQKTCGDVFGSSKSVSESFGNYIAIVGDEKTGDDFDKFSESCNCGLEKYRRDEFDVEKKERDDICFKLYKN